MNWISLDSPEQLKAVKEISENERVLLLMFSRGNSINYVVRFLLGREWNESEMNMKTYIVDVNSNKIISSEIAKDFGTDIEAPQALIIDKGKAVLNVTYGRILYSELRKFSN